MKQKGHAGLWFLVIMNLIIAIVWVIAIIKHNMEPPEEVKSNTFTIIINHHERE